MKDMILNGAKFILLVLLAVMLTGIVRGTRRQADFDTLKAKVLAAVDTSSMQQGDAQLLRRLYGLNAGELKGWTLYTAIDNMAVEEVLLVECAYAEQVEPVRKAAQDRADTQKNNFEGYGPEQVQLIEKSVLKEEDPYVLFVISKDANQAKAAFLKELYSGF